MDNGLMVFQNKEFGQVRTIYEDGKVLFCGSDVAKALGYTNPTKALGDHCRQVTMRRGNDSLGRVQEMSFILESDVYRLIFQSRLPSAEKFTDWVTEDILPTIRKKGAYATSVHALFNALEDAHITEPSVAKPLTQATRAYRDMTSGKMFVEHRDDMELLPYCQLMEKLWHGDTQGKTEAIRNYQKYRKVISTPYNNYTERIDAVESLPEPKGDPITPAVAPIRNKAYWEDVFCNYIATCNNLTDVQAYHAGYIKLGIPHQYDNEFYKRYKRIAQGARRA